jgi:chromate transport protein ChrA
VTQQPASRISPFAVTCFVASLITFPCNVGWLLHRAGIPRGLLAFVLPPACVLLVSIGCYQHIKSSDGRLRGRALAGWAIGLSALWTLLMLIAELFFGGWTVGNMH